jgi:hypothetical protein
MHSTVRIECLTTDGSRSTGTGFFFNFLEDGKTHVPAIVTNKHVVRNAAKGTFCLTKRNSDNTPNVGEFFRVEFENFGSLWIQHPDPDVDLAVFPVASVLKQASDAGLVFFYVALNAPLIPTADQIMDLSGFDEIVMVGYPNGIWDSRNNLPIMRAGVTATHVRYDYEKKPFFLIDCACFPGSSGSPVFIYNSVGWKSRNGTIRLDQERLLFLGVLFAGPQHKAEGAIVEVDVLDLAKVAKSISSIPNNLGVVVKSPRLLEFNPILETLRGAA